MVEDQMSKDRGRLSPFERQMEAVRAGAGISIVPRMPAPDYAFTLGGASPL